jgi:putative ABC transport system permease protein
MSATALPTARAPAPSQPFPSPSLWLALRLAFREMRGGLRGFGVFIGCIALGVAAIVGVASVARGLTDGLAREGRTILGGDIAFETVQRELTSSERQWLEARGALTTAGMMRAMARSASGETALVEIKAVDAAYPQQGRLITSPEKPVPALLGEVEGRFGAVTEAALLARLNLKSGDELIIGDAVLTLRAEIVTEPDKLAGGVGFGPRLLISQEALKATGLIQPGTLIRYKNRLTLPPGQDSDAAMDTIIADAKAAFPDAAFEIDTRNNASPAFQRNLERFTQFLTLVGFTALVVGGVGVANGAHAFVDRKRVPFATLKSLGATGGFVFMASLFQVMMLSLIGIALGLVIGAVLPFIVIWLVGALIPFPMDPSVYPRELALGVLYGILAALTFSIWPLGRAHDIPVSALFRDLIDGKTRLPRRRYLVLIAIAAIALCLVSVLFAWERRIALIYIGASIGTFVLLRLVAFGLMAIARRLPRPKMTELRLALINTHKPGSLTPSVVMSLGLGVSLLVSLTLIDGNIRTQLTRNLPDQAPSFFFVDIRKDQLPEFTRFMNDRVKDAKLDTVPMMRGRIMMLKGIKAEDYQAAEEARWVLDGDRGITYSPNLPAGSKLTAGEWWSPDHKGSNLVSFDQELAGELGLTIGDKLVVNVLGRNIEVTIANLRTVEWRSLGINFVMVFSPNTFAGAPYTTLATLTFPDKTDAARELSLLRETAAAFPAVTTVRVRDALEAVNTLVGQLATAIRGAATIALIASVLVLSGALAAGHRARVYEAVVLKTLGATRPRLLLAFVLEYGIIGLATAAFGFAAGVLSAYIIITNIMEIEFAMLWPVALLAVVVGLSVTIVLGLLQTWRILGQKPAPYLRTL